MKLLQHGDVECILNPHGRFGVFKAGKIYKFQMVEYLTGEQYYRVASGPGKYQAIDKGAFKRYFKKRSMV